MRGPLAEQVAAVLQQQGAVVTGTLCGGGLPNGHSPSGITSECGTIVDGHIDGNHVRFGAPIGSDGETFYLAVDAFASADGSRIQGRFFEGIAPPTGPDDLGWYQVPETWQPLDGPMPAYADSDWFDVPGNWPADVPWSCSNGFQIGYDLTFVGGTAGATEFGPGQTPLLMFCDDVVGDLGTFGGPDLRFTSGPDGKTTAIEAGPVPETVPGLATRMTISLDGGGRVVGVEAGTASGATYSFTAAPSTRGPIY
jgi:hypothetical protein